MTSAATGFEEQHEKNMRILGLIRDDPGWALSRILRCEELEDAIRDLLNDPRSYDPESCRKPRRG